MVSDICFHNAYRYFGLEVAPENGERLGELTAKA